MKYLKITLNEYYKGQQDKKKRFAKTSVLFTVNAENMQFVVHSHEVTISNLRR
jgi:hypothetical protein